MTNRRKQNDAVVGDFVPAYDADRNATLIKTATGTWSVSYNAENRPVRFECAGTQTVVEMNYDYLGRRFEKKITVAGTTTLHHRYIYRGFLQIACLDLTRAGTPALWFVFWDPTQPTATRPLAIQKNGTWFVYGHDLTKNVCEVFGSDGYIKTTYSYSPFGNVSSVGNFEQNFQWSSEFYDPEVGLVYYNYRHYSPTTARWLSRDPIEEMGGLNLYCFCGNNPIKKWDELGFAFRDEDLSGRADPIFQKCCGNKKYNDKKECCLEENGRKIIRSRDKKIFTGVSYYVRRTRWYYIPIYRPWSITQFFLMHAWFSIDGAEWRAGSYPQGIDFEEKEYALKEGETLTFKKDISLAVCDYKVEDFSQCVKNKAKQGNNWHPWNNCLDWVYDTIDACKKEVKRK